MQNYCLLRKKNTYLFIIFIGMISVMYTLAKSTVCWNKSSFSVLGFTQNQNHTEKGKTPTIHHSHQQTHPSSAPLLL